MGPVSLGLFLWLNEMKNNLIFWKMKLIRNNSRKNVIVFLIGFLLIIIFVAGLGIYLKKANDEQQAAEVERLKLKRTQDSITTFYVNAFTGIDLNQLPGVMREIEHSRLPFNMVGYTESEYNCINKSCRFIYELSDSFVFSVIDKKFFNVSYEGSFSENTLNFENLMINSDESQLHKKMNAGEQIDAIKCSNLLNYLYGYNSVMDKSDRVKVVKLPYSTVESAEKQYPSYRDSYSLLTGEFEVQIPDGFSETYFFSEKIPYKDFFIVQNIEKPVKTDTDVILKGVFVCKK